MRSRAAAARVGRLATVGADARPHLVPMTFALDGDRLCTAVDDKPKSSRRLRRLENVAANAAVTVLIDHYDDDWSRLWWVRLDGDAHAEPEATDRWLALLAEKYAVYRASPPDGPFLVVEISRWTGWTATPDTP
jgi:PPOX class probable F420-dependent enzyme